MTNTHRRARVAAGCSTAALAAVMALAGSAGADTTNTLSAANQGHYSKNGIAINNNYAVINESSFLAQHAFAVFDLSTVSGPITSATLTLPNTSCGGSSNAAVGSVISVWDVSTPADQLSSGPGNATIYADLGGGTSYGTATLATANPAGVSVTLDGAALSAIQGGEGESGFAVGLSLTATAAQLMFNGTTSASGCVPTLTFTIGEVVDTPMFSRETLGGAGVVALLAAGYLLYRRRSAAAISLDGGAA